MKMFAIFALALVGSYAQADSPIVGPYISYRVGAAGTDAPYATCVITPSFVSVRKGDGTISSKPLALNAENLKSAIIGAALEPIETALHIMATVPPVTISAGIFPDVEDTLLLKDSSDVKFRNGASGEALVETAKRLCGNMDPK